MKAVVKQFVQIGDRCGSDTNCKCHTSISLTEMVASSDTRWGSGRSTPRSNLSSSYTALPFVLIVLRRVPCYSSPFYLSGTRLHDHMAAKSVCLVF
jgi:hypothetical protein